MALFPRMSSLHHPTRSTYRDDLNPFFSLLNDTFSELQRLSDTLPNDSDGNSGTTIFAPRFDVKETSDSYELQGELPGVAQQDLAIEFADDHTLTVKGRTEHSREQGGRGRPSTTQLTQQAHEGVGHGHGHGDAKDSKEMPKTADGSSSSFPSSQEVVTSGPTPQHHRQHTYWVTERSVGEFSRTFSFPHRVDQDGATAALKNGVLSVVVPKLAKQRATRKVITVETE